MLPSRRASPAFAGGVVSRLIPSVVRLVLLLIVARKGGLDDVGRLALATAATYLCGNLAEVGTMTSLSLPQTYFGERLPPLRATRTLRFVAALAGTVLYGLLWAAGLGSHEPVFVVGLALPAVLAISFGYAGALNATGALALEGGVSLVEAGLVIGLAFAFFPVTSPVAAALIAMTLGRLAATVARALLVRRRPQSPAEAVPGAVRAQLWFLAATAAIVVEGQVDILVLGFAGTFALLGVYAPLIRMCYSVFLVAEGLTLAMYSSREGELRRWRTGAVAISLVAAAVFLVVARPLLELIVDEKLPHLTWPIVLLAVLIPIRFAGYVFSVDLVRAGRQALRIPVVVLAMLVLAGGAIAGWRTGSLTWLSAFRLASEIVITLGFAYLVRRFAGRVSSATALSS